MISIVTNKVISFIGDIKAQETAIDINDLTIIYTSIKIFFNQ